MHGTLLDWLTARYPTAKRQTLKRMVEAGRVTINGRRATKLKDSVADDDDVRVSERAKPAQGPARTERLPFRIVFEDANVLVVVKPAGLLTSTVPREPRPTLLAAVRDYVAQTDLKSRVGLIHRLDRDASGLLIFSKSDDAYRSLKRQFFDHTVGRTYTAVVEGVPNPRSGRIRSRLIERADGTMRPATQPGKGDLAITDFEMIAQAGERSVLRVTLQTGRKHQIRAHLAGRGCPIVGDAMYGAKSHTGPLMLAATALEFDHPRTGMRLKFESPPPWPLPQ